MRAGTFARLGPEPRRTVRNDGDGDGHGADRLGAAHERPHAAGVGHERPSHMNGPVT